ncbi:MAG: DUF4258 domain-containing protein [Tepidisphaeraceae bacterium]
MPEPNYQLSQHAKRRIERRQIRLEWISATLANPDRTDPDHQDPALRHALKKIQEMDNRVLRVVYNSTVVPPRIVSVHFDRRLKGAL